MTASATTFHLTQAPVAKTEMLIRAPVADVFEAFIDPERTSKFWFTRGSGRLEPGKQVRWDWDMYGVFADVDVKEVEPNKRILAEWGGPDEPPTTVEWRFLTQSDGTTFVSITNSGFHGNGDEVVAQAIDAMGGFSLVLAGLKAWLEHGIDLHLVVDRFPSGKDDPQ